MPDSYHHGALPAALLQVAETILERDGADGLTLRSAARAAGVSHTAPAHHFGDLSGLLSELAAVGFQRLADQLDGAARAASKSSRLKAIGKSYVHFARAHPNLFLLMFRSRRLDRKRLSLRRASEAAFAVLRGTIEPEPQEEARASLQSHAKSIAAWSLVHGFAMLMIDDRLPTKWRINDLLHAVLSSGY